MRKPLILLLAAISITACSKGNPMSSLPDLAQVKANLAFTCTQEADHLPPLDPQADQLFQYARYLQTRSGPKDFDASRAITVSRRPMTITRPITTFNC